MQQFAEDPSRKPPRPGCSKKNCGGSIRCCSRRPRKARVPGGHALTVDREVFAAEVTARHRGRAAHRTAPRGSHRAFPRTPSSIIATGPLTSDALAEEIARAHRLGPAVLLRQHQPHRRRRFGRHRHRLLGLALRQIDRRHRRLPELPVRPRAIRALRRRAAAGAERLRAHRRGRHAVLRSLPAHRGAGAARPRDAALRPHEADGPDRSAHRPAALRGGAAAPGKPARRTASTWWAFRTT